MTSPSPDTGLVERLRTAIDLGTQTGARGKHPTNIYNIAAEALEALTSQQQEPVGDVEVFWTNEANIEAAYKRTGVVGGVFTAERGSSATTALVRLSDHQRAIAERDAEIERLTREVEMAKEFIADEQRQNAALADQSARISTLEAQLVEARKRMRNARGAIETGQITDKDVHGMMERGIREIDAALNKDETGGAG